MMTTERPFLFAHMLQVSKWSLRNLIAWGKGILPLDVNRQPLSLCPFVADLNKIALKSDFIYIFFMFHHMYVAPGRGRQSIGDKILMTTEMPFLFAHMLQVSKWSLRNRILYTLLMILYMYIALGYLRKPLEDKLLMSTESPYHFDHLLQVSNKSLSTLILYIFFNVFHVYIDSPRAETDNPLWTKFLCQQKGLVTLPICWKFKKNIFEVWFYTYFCLFLYMCIAPGQR